MLLESETVANKSQGWFINGNRQDRLLPQKSEVLCYREHNHGFMLSRFDDNWSTYNGVMMDTDLILPELNSSKKDHVKKG